MDLKKKITISWSGGKDSAFALYKLLQAGEFSVVHLHTVFGETTKRVGLHGIHESLIEEQANALWIPLVKLYLRESDNHDAYQTLMQNFYRECAAQGITHVMFGDIFLEDLKAFRDKMLEDAGVKGVYPIWKIDSRKLIDEFLREGFKTMLCAAKSEFFTADKLGRTITPEMVASFHERVDPCGENGEFHTFVYDGPIFRQAVALEKREVISKSYQYNVQDSKGTITAQHTAFWFQEISTKG